MSFHIGQKIVCVDASPPANPWHRAHPLILNKIYIVQSLEGPFCIGIDSSGRAWQNWRFRPLVERKTDITIFEQLLTPAKPKHLVDV
jgi:hypothetical protein